jgi:carbon monoxide dehydrogenase subunit G
VRFYEQFDIKQPPAEVWEFFERVDEVARCLPGVESVEVHDADNLDVKVTQSVGPMTATFQAKVKITDRDPGRRIAFTAVGKTVRGASGNIRATNAVVLEQLDGVGTRVRVDADVALAGVLGSVGQKIIAKQASRVAGQFAGNLEHVLSREQVPARGDAPRAASAPSTPAATSRTYSTVPEVAEHTTPNGIVLRLPESLTRPPQRWEFLLAVLLVLFAIGRRRR